MDDNRPPANRRRLGVLLLGLTLLLTTLLSFGGSQGASGARAVRYLDPITDSVRVDKDLVYGRVVREDAVEKLRLDLYRPAGERRGNRPVVIFIHGGDSSVDKSFDRNRIVSRSFARRGFVAATINYRKNTNGVAKDSQEDTRAAVRWFRANASRYGVNPAKITVLGVSAGGINALQVGFNPQDAGSSGNPGYSSKVASAVSISGTAYEVLEIGADEVPVAMVHALDDTTIPIVAARAVCEQTRALGNTCRFFEYAEGGHPPRFLNQNRGRIIEQVSVFLCSTILSRQCGSQLRR